MSVFSGVAHVHSTYSFDGELPLKDLAQFFKARGVRFVLLSEHIESLDAEKIARLVGDCASLSDESLLLIPGIEIDAIHALFFGVRPPGEWQDYADLARRLAQGGALTAVSHPVKITQEIPEVTAGLVESVEIWNSRHDGKIAADGSIVAYWRSLQQRLKRPLAPLCGIDFHNRHDFLPLTLDVECGKLDQVSILAAIRERRYHLALAGKKVPLDSRTGRLPLDYRVYSNLYRLVYRAVYAGHRASIKVNLRPPKRMKALLRKMF